ncbi:MAG: efflux RND transporter periplasmic adaptor subunit [Pseudomonadota bacterium]
MLAAPAGAQTPPTSAAGTPLLDIPARSDQPDATIHDIRVQIVAKTSAVIGAPMAGRLTQFPLRDGDRFTQGQPLAQFVCVEQEAMLTRARALAEGKRHIFETQQKLHKLGTSSELDFQVAEAELHEAEAGVAVTRAVIQNCAVAAPFAGRVANIMARNHQFVAIGAPLLEILSDRELEIELILPSRWLGWLGVGTKFDLTVDELSRSFHAELTRISGKVDAVSRSIKVYGRILDPSDALLPGMSGRALLAPPSEAVAAKR